jgi:hypothetical protein
MWIRASAYGHSAPSCKVELAHVSPIPTIAVPAVPPVPKSLLYDTAHRSTPSCSLGGERNHTDGRVSRSPEQDNDVWTTTANESEDVWYHDRSTADDGVEMTKEDFCVNSGDLDSQTVDFCDTSHPPSLWYPVAMMIDDPAQVVFSPSSGVSSTSSTFGDTTRAYDETFALVEEASEILRKSYARLMSQRYVRANFSQKQTTRRPYSPPISKTIHHMRICCGRACLTNCPLHRTIPSLRRWTRGSLVLLAVETYERRGGGER